ncbi:MAG: hypothetical protein Q7R35_08720 [Elusimicrobiota bacterium]|nr:hypothetical protein [Elusimicrobiota bacterium]
MNFYNEDEKKDGAPVMPSTASTFKKASAFGKTPMFSRAAGSITDRLKNLSRKDMAFVAIGLSVLVMTPVAEYMMSQPSQDNMLKAGFGDRGKEGSSGPYEPGIHGLSQGSSDGSGDVITPLSSRDPASLILGSQPAQPAMAPAAPPSTNFRDAMKESGRNAFTEAAKSAGAPTPIPKMQAGLRSLSFGGGEGTRTSGSMGGGKIIEDAQSASNKAKKRSMLGPVAMAGYKGVANTPNSASKGAFEKLRAQADKSAGNFSGGSATGALDRAAADALDIGRGGGGMGAGGDSEKTTRPSGSTNKNERSKSGETLEEMMAKKRMEKALEWEFFKKYEIKKQIITAALTGFNNALTKFVEGAANGAFGNGSGAPQVYICVQLKPGEKDCLPGKMIAAMRSDKEKTVDGWISRGTCACGPMTPEEFAIANGGAAPGPVGPGPVGPGPVGPGPVTPDPAVTAGVKEMFGTYDTTLKRMLMDMQEGAKVKKAEELLKYDISIAAGFPNLKADSVAMAVKNGAAAARDGEVEAYKKNIADARYQVSLVKADYAMFRDKFDKVHKAAKDGTLKAASTSAGGVSMTVNISQSVLPSLNQAEATLTSYEQGCMVKVDTKLAYNDRALEVFNSQLGYVDTGAQGVSDIYRGDVLGAANRISAELKAIVVPANGQITLKADQDKIIKFFKDLTGSASAVPVAPDAPAVIVPPAQVTGAKLDPNALAFNTSGIKDFRDGVGDTPAVPAGDQASPPLIDKPVLWRGLPINKPFDGDKANDAAAIAAEAADWKTASPRGKATIDQVVDLDNMAKESLLAEALRGSLHIPGDAKASQIDPKAAAALLQPVKDKMAEVTAQLAAWKIDMDNPTGGPNPGGTDPVATTGLGDVSNTAANMSSDMATQIAGDQERYKQVKDSGKCKSTECQNHLLSAKGNLDVMNKYKADVAALQVELKPGITAERLAQIKDRLAKINTAMDGQIALSEQGRFDTSLAAAAKMAKVPAAVHPAPVPVPVQPVHVTVIANGGNATANAQGGHGGDANANANANAVNNTTVKPPVVVNPPAVIPQPVIHPVAPKPAVAPKEFSVGMTGGAFMKLITNNNSGATATYTGSYRQGFMDWLYKYEVVCTRSGNVFNITRAQRTKAIFSTGVTVGGPEPVSSLRGVCR